MDEIYRRILDLSRQGGEAMLVTLVQKEGSTPALPGAKMLAEADGMSLGTVGGGELERVARIKANELLQTRESELVRYALLEGEQVSEAGDDEALPMWCGGRVTLFYEHLGYDTYVYLFGAGHVGSAIAAHLRNLKCYVTVIDHRPEVMAQLPPVNRQIVGEYASALADESVPQGAYFVIGTPAHAADYEVLKTIMSGGWAPRYVGMLGSRRKSQELTRRLVDELGSAIDLSVLYTPVGLDIGGASPDEIAISIIAEIQALRYGKQGHNHMRSANPLLCPNGS